MNTETLAPLDRVEVAIIHGRLLDMARRNRRAGNPKIAALCLAAAGSARRLFMADLAARAILAA